MNKRILVLAISVLCFQMAGFSQTRVGLSTGVSVANMKGRVDGDGKAGVMASLVLDVPMCKKKNFSFYPTLSYVQKGIVEPHPEGTLPPGIWNWQLMLFIISPEQKQLFTWVPVLQQILTFLPREFQ
jgi:hypothetical protein